MNSYPPELLAQLAPVMFVAGLDAPQPQPLKPSQVDPDVPPPPPAKTNNPNDAFHALSQRLRDALLSQRKVAIWQPEKTKSFQVVLVDRDVKFPPRKLVPQDDPQYSVSHSPLSPLTPTSPLHPDGLIAPIWVRKHTTLVPSVFVVFMRLYEHPPHVSKTPLDVFDTERDREREAEEKKRDSELAAEVALRKKMTNDRGIKLTVVLMASRKMLDDPVLDTRLTFIRRQSGLDSRAALFVLSPVSPAELAEFVRSLQQALYEPAIEYYTGHSKRVRRKRNRHSQAVVTYPNTTIGLSAVNIARPLRPEGWTVRYEYKMACFAEFRSEDEVALKHYQDAYEALLIMFGSTAILPPRTKRWAEAKVLADCINIKIVKLYLYNNEFALALSHHSTHIRQFGDFSRGWGIGEETFEFWSWIARQHRVLAELLEQGTRTSLTIPIHKPVITNSTLVQSQQTTRSQGEYDTMRSLGVNPNHALQHPGFYYYMAARCTESRRERFLAAVEAETNKKPVAMSPGFANEKKVEHLAIINELYTKSYELFKKHSPSTNQAQSRLTLWIAYRIAQTYYDAGKFDMAVRFFERIAKTYRREKWHALLRPLLSTWYACAKGLGDMELSVRLLVEMLGHDVVEVDGPESLEQDLIAIFCSSVPTSSEEPMVVDLTEAQPIFDTAVAFWSSEVNVDECAAFQVTLVAPRQVVISSVPFSRLSIRFSGDADAAIVLVSHDDSGSENAGGNTDIRRVDLGYVKLGSGEAVPSIKANLRWKPGQTIVFTGSISSNAPIILRITALTLHLEENAWKVDVPFEPLGSNAPPRWLCALNPPRFIPLQRESFHSTVVKHRPHHLKITFHHDEPAFLDEDYPIEIEVMNTDSRELDLSLNILLQPTEIDEAVNWVIIDGEKSTSLIKDVPLGVVSPGKSVVKTLHLFNTGAGGDRMLDISVQSQTNVTIEEEDGNSEEDEEEEGEGEEEEIATKDVDTMEHLNILVVKTLKPFSLTQSVAYRRSQEAWTGLADLDTFEGSYWDAGRTGVALITSTVSCTGPWSLYVHNLKLERKDTNVARVTQASTDLLDDEMFPAEYENGDEFCGNCEVNFRLDDEFEVSQEAISGPGQYVVTWSRLRPNGDQGPESTSYFRLPDLQPPKDELIALLDAPLEARLHVPIFVTLTVRNYHASRSANITVQLETDQSDGFVASGIRSGRMPVLLPSTEEKVTWRMIPTECGYVRIPRIKVTDRRKVQSLDAGDPSGGEMVKVVDIHRDARQPTDGAQGSDDAVGTIFVLP